MNILRTTFAAGCAVLAGSAAAAVCSATSGAQAPQVIELYTSEGCSSCPPADRWLSTLKGRSDVLALSFHVDYWDRLGWADRFASRAATDRQYGWARTHRSNNVYTPQVVAGGQDWRRWPALPPAAVAAGASAPRLTLQREGQRVKASVSALAGGSGRLGGYWAVLEDGHQSRVLAGENSGETLRHDHVVRLYQPLAEWPAGTAQQLELPVLDGNPTNPRRVALVVFDAANQRPLQALSLALSGGC